ncbi:MAG: hypothetical protein JXA00_01085 [Candidatus Thermoplasmatota archaeon]|nr:hypothetical protein [Candidatus Thermoplasmatota archaeon]
MSSVNFLTVAAMDAGFIQMMWSLTILVLLLSTIAVYIVLVKLSKKPKEWRHVSLVETSQRTGQLRDLAESLKNLPEGDAEQAPLHALVRRLFFEKIKATQDISEESVRQLYQNNRALMATYIHDAEIEEWLLSVSQPPRGTVFGVFSKEKRGENHSKEKVRRIVEKMEAW